MVLINIQVLQDMKSCLRFTETRWLHRLNNVQAAGCSKTSGTINSRHGVISETTCLHVFYSLVKNVICFHLFLLISLNYHEVAATYLPAKPSVQSYNMHTALKDTNLYVTNERTRKSKQLPALETGRATLRRLRYVRCWHIWPQRTNWRHSYVRLCNKPLSLSRLGHNKTWPFVRKKTGNVRIM